MKKNVWSGPASVLAIVLAVVAAGCSPKQEASPPAGEKQVWTCSMHPQIRLPGPGKCPICEMPLIPAAGAAAGTASLQLSEQALAMAGVETAPVVRRDLARELRTVGKVQYNEASLAVVTARTDGYAERLLADYTGMEVGEGDPLVEVYSPDLFAAQQEYLNAVRSGPGSALAELAAQRLQRWGLTRAQVEALAAGGKPAERIMLHSPAKGTVVEKAVVQQSAFKAGDVLYRIADLRTVWVQLEVYEMDLPAVRAGQPVEFTAEALPGRVFSGTVEFVQPVVNEATRTVQVRVRADNPDGALKPGLYVSAVIRAQPERSAPPAAGWFCPMKCEGSKVYEQPGNCPVCGMKLEAVPVASGTGALSVPAGAVLDSGTRRVVYVERSRGLFELREVVLGPRSGGYYPVVSGVSEGERVAVRGGFLLDSQAQISGQLSLFHPDGLGGEPAPHAH